MEPIGGYFSLELPQHEEYHKDAIRLNTGRNCLEYILRSREYSKIYIPFYTCEVVLEPLKKMGVPYEFYHINFEFEIEEDIILKQGEALLYTNYFGLKQRYSERLAKKYGNSLIIDNTQAFYAKPIESVDSFYTCRKFFGVSDGAYLYTDQKLEMKFTLDKSYDRMGFLLKRIDLGAEEGYPDFKELSRQLVGQPIKYMSNITQRLMQSIDYQGVARKRIANYLYLHEYLASSNQLGLPLFDDAVPMVYPYLSCDRNLKQKLIAQSVFVATYWPTVCEYCPSDNLECLLAEQTVYIPVDQRYGIENMKKIIDIINN